MAGSRERTVPSAKVPICTDDLSLVTIFDVLRHGGVKIEAYSLAQAGKNPHRLRSVDVAPYRVSRSKIYVWDVRLRRPIQRFAVISSNYFDFYSFIKAEVRVAGYLTRDDCSAPVRGADPLRQKCAHAQRPASRGDRRLDPRIWFHQPGADRRTGRSPHRCSRTTSDRA